MQIKGFQGTSLLDFPGMIASLVFFGGCNLSCPFCHNPALVNDYDQFPDYPIDDLLEDLALRSSFIDGVVISGGEPTLAPDLLPLIVGIRELGLKVKLDTNGLSPLVLKGLFDRQLLDYVAIDLKTTPERYTELHHQSVNAAALKVSISLVKESGVAHEFRTTCVPRFVGVEEMRMMGGLLRGASLWVLQQFNPEHSLDENLRDSVPYSSAVIQEFAGIAAGYVAAVKVRGV